MIRLTVTTEIETPFATFLPWLARTSPVGMFEGYGPIPGVARVEGQSGGWDAAGARRRLVMSDGSVTFEEVTKSRLPYRFAYRMTGFTGIMDRLVREIRGEWVCKERDQGGVLVRWSYTFVDKGWLARLVLCSMRWALWQGYMRAGLARVRREAETRQKTP